MSDFNCSEIVVLRLLQTGLKDGQVQYREQTASAVVIESSGFATAVGGSAELEFLISGSGEIPPGSQLIWRGTLYDIGSVRRCRDLDGNVRGTRCSVA
ncbi:MAG: hypothetical protein LBM70_02160 [Victivallales bacterium]|jgi:hypothetical protein|nr:hypothetical protein [Victivallales bacterium]